MHILLLCVTLGACASLPDVTYLKDSLNPGTVPTIENGQGKITARKTESLLARKLRNSRMDIKTLAALEEAATGSPLIAGNKVTLLFDGPQTMSSMTEVISGAKDHINLETYIFEQDEIGLRFADLLIAKQKEGVQVNVIYDSVGSLKTPPQFFQRMKDAGIHLLAFNPVNPLARLGRWRLNNRDHRKILVVDGKVGFAGGVNISATYANSSVFRSGRGKEGEHDGGSGGSGSHGSSGKVGWRDTHIKIEGPAVALLQYLFLETWAKQSGKELPESDFFPALKEEGNKLVRILGSEPGGDYDIYKSYFLAIQEARKSIHITSAYFVPDRQILDALMQAARRGVDVRLVLPSVSDSGLVMHAGQSFYEELLESGVKVHQLQIAVLHAKTAVIDGVWSTIGSTNIDTRSFLHNNEVNVIILGEEFGRDMESAFQEDLRHTVEVTKEQWKHRPFVDRVKEWTGRTFEYWL